MAPTSAIVVLGCRPARGRDGALQGALGRRVAAAARAWAERGPGTLVVASGGCGWRAGARRVVEADAMAKELERLGVAPEDVARERCSLTTRDNARYVRRLLARRGIDHATVVTCAWHLPRALALFARAGLRVDGLAVEGPPIARPRAAWRWGKERVARWIDLALAGAG